MESLIAALLGGTALGWIAIYLVSWNVWAITHLSTLLIKKIV